MSSREAETAPMEAILVSGVSGTGKTTVSRLLAERFPRAVAIEADVLSNIFVRSPSLRHAGVDVWKPLMELRQRQVCLLADSYAEANFVPVIDDVVTAEVLEQYRNHLKLRPLLLVTLEPQVAVAFARDAGRERPLQREFLTTEILARWDADLRSTMGGIGLHLDTSTLTADETVDQILSHLHEAIVLT